MTARHAFLVAALAVAGLSAVAARRTAPALVIITLDTTRADRLPPYGFMNASLPAIDRLAREGVVFDRATTVAPLTLPAHCTIFTALLPLHHGVRDNGDPPLADAHITLAEILAAQGFHTAAFVGSQVLAADRGLAQGFELYRSATPIDATAFTRYQRRADAVVSDAIDWLGGVGQSERFFLWVHLYDPHRPYDPPEPYRSSYADPYLGEIAFADAQIARLLDALERRHRLERAIVVLAGDHGESLGDHGERDHGMLLYESVLHVPLILRAPDVAASRVPDLVSLADLAPTALALLGVRPPSDAVDGRSVADIIQGSHRTIQEDGYAESLYPERFGGTPLRSLRDRRFKFIDAPDPELYDLDRDPFEERNIYSERPAVAAAVKERLVALTRGDATAVARARASVAPDVRERLAALGYVAAPSSK